MADWKITVTGPDETILVQVVGAIGVSDASDAAARVSELLAKRTTACHLCFDISEISSYAVKAREDWSALLKEHKLRISALTWVTSRSTHRMVGRTVGLFTGIPTTIRDDLPVGLRGSA